MKSSISFAPPAAACGQICQPKAFTLIELLAVVGVIGVLACLAIPTIGSGMKKARQSAGISNLRQIGVAMLTYAGENDNRMPHCWDSSTGKTYAHLIGEYLPQDLRSSERNVFCSPAAEKQIVSGTHTIAVTYSAHPRVCNETNASGDFRVPMQMVAHPSRLIILADGSQLPWNNNQSTASFWNPGEIFAQDPDPLLRDKLIPAGPDSDTDAAQGWFRYRNSGALHALMADCHVQVFKKGTVTYGNVHHEL